MPRVSSVRQAYIEAAADRDKFQHKAAAARATFVKIMEWCSRSRLPYWMRRQADSIRAEISRECELAIREIDRE